MNKHFVTPFFEPQNIAIIGASDTRGSLGDTLMQQLLQANYAGKLLPVIPGIARCMACRVLMICGILMNRLT